MLAAPLLTNAPLYYKSSLLLEKSYNYILDVPFYTLNRNLGV